MSFERRRLLATAVLLPVASAARAARVGPKTTKLSDNQSVTK
jgi:hypothetical protein